MSVPGQPAPARTGPEEVERPGTSGLDLLLNSSARAARGRAASTAERLAELRVRIERLASGDPTTPADVTKAHRWALAQAVALEDARDRLLLMHRSAQLRHEQCADQHATAGQTRAAERERAAAARQHHTIERILSDRTARSRPAAPDLRPGAGVAGPDEDQITRLRDGLAALLSWSGGVDPVEVDRRQVWSRSIVDQCGAPRWRSWIHAVCRAGACALNGVRGVAITVVNDGGAALAAASDNWTSQVQELELIVGEGPSTTAQTGRRVVVDDLQVERQGWQGYASAISGLDVRGLCALPLQVHGLCVGSLTCYYRGPLTDRDGQDLADAIAFCEVAAAALIADVEQMRQRGPVADDRFLVHVAVGRTEGASASPSARPTRVCGRTRSARG